jgi:hypothetical protein
MKILFVPYKLVCGLVFYLVAVRALNSTDAPYAVCSLDGALNIASVQTTSISSMFSTTAADVEFMRYFFVEMASRGGLSGALLNTSLANLTQGWGDDDPTRWFEIWYGNVAKYNKKGLYTDGHSINDDLQLLQSMSLIFPQLVDRRRLPAEQYRPYQTVSTITGSEQSLVVAAWAGTKSETWIYYPGFPLLGLPDYNFGDILSADYDSSNSTFIIYTREEVNPDRKVIWTPPYGDDATDVRTFRA